MTLASFTPRAAAGRRGRAEVQAAAADRHVHHIERPRRRSALMELPAPCTEIVPPPSAEKPVPVVVAMSSPVPPPPG